MDIRKEYLQKILEKEEDTLVFDLKDDFCTFSFIRSNIEEALELLELINEETKEKKEIRVDIVSDVFYHLIKNRDCKVFSVKTSKGEDCTIIEDFIEWHLSPEEAVEKIKSMWVENGDNASPAVQPWFKIKKETK